MKCSYCGRDMSSEFSECPHCGKVVPRPVVCCVCQQAMNSTEAILNKHVGLKRFLHPYSYKAVLEEQVCPVCKYVFTENEQSRWGWNRYGISVSCPNCKHRALSKHECGICLLGILYDDAVRTGARARDHQACLKGQQMVRDRNKAQEEQRLEKHRKAGECTFCGQALGFWDKLFRRDIHSHHGLI